MEEIKKETPATEEKPVEEKKVEEVKQEETAPTSETKSQDTTIEQNELVEENAKLKAFRNETVLKQNGFKPEYNAWIQTLAEKDGKNFDNAEEIAAYLKDKKFDVFKNHTFNQSANVVTENKEEQSQGKKPKTQEEIDTTYIYIPGLDKENNK